MFSSPNESFVSLRVSRDRAREQEKAIHLELAVNGSLADRKLVALGDPFPDSDRLDGGAAGAGPRRVIARWGLTAEEMGLPLDPAKVARLEAAIVPALLATGSGFASLFPGSSAGAVQAVASMGTRLAAGAWRMIFHGHALRLPARITEPLRALCARLLGDGEPLWLEIHHPSGYLPLVPWEHLIRVCVPGPILRLSPHPVHPVTPDRPLRVAVCVSAGSQRRLLSPHTLAEALVEIRDGLPAASLVHVFADRTHYAGVEALPPGPAGAAGSEIRIHDPSGAAPHGPDAAGTEHPWVRWMASALAGEALDLVHWISPGRLGTDRGCLAVLANPAAEPNAERRVLGYTVGEPRLTAAGAVRLVSAEEMHTFLNRVGAWGAVLSSPGDELSRSALRFLVDDLARLRPGPCALHEFGGAEAGTLRRLYASIVSPAAIDPPQSPCVQVYSHPVARTPAPPAAVPLAGIAVPVVVPERSTEQWVASGRRLIEQNVAECLSADESHGLTAAARRGRENGIAFLSQLIAQAESAGEGGPS